MKTVRTRCTALVTLAITIATLSGCSRWAHRGTTTADATAYDTSATNTVDNSWVDDQRAAFAQQQADSDAFWARQRADEQAADWARQQALVQSQVDNQTFWNNEFAQQQLLMQQTQ
jgi:hypothetical protein